MPAYRRTQRYAEPQSRSQAWRALQGRQSRCPVGVQLWCACAFVRGQLLDHEAEAQFEDDLQQTRRSRSVIVSPCSTGLSERTISRTVPVLPTMPVSFARKA